MERKGLLFFLMTAVLLMVTLAVSLPSVQAGRDYLVVQTWGGALGEAEKVAFFEPFTKETGIKVVDVEAGVDVGGKLEAMQRSGNIEWDMLSGDYENYMAKYYRRGYLADIDYNIVKDTDGLLPGSLKKWGVASYLEGVCLVYNTKYFPKGKGPQSWADFFDVKKFPGPRAMHNWGGPADNLAIATMASGLQPDELWPMDYERAFKMMDKVKPAVRVWYTSGDQLVQALMDEEVVMAVSTDGRAKLAIAMGAPLEIVYNQAFYFLTYWTIVKGSPMEEAANRLINFTCRPDLQAIFMQKIHYSTANVKAIQYLPPELQRQQMTHPDNVGKVFDMMEVKNARKYMLPEIEKIDEMWNAWIAK